MVLGSLPEACKRRQAQVGAAIREARKAGWWSSQMKQIADKLTGGAKE